MLLRSVRSLCVLTGARIGAGCSDQDSVSAFRPCTILEEVAVPFLQLLLVVLAADITSRDPGVLGNVEIPWVDQGVMLVPIDQTLVLFVPDYGNACLSFTVGDHPLRCDPSLLRGERYLTIMVCHYQARSLLPWQTSVSVVSMMGWLSKVLKTGILASKMKCVYNRGAGVVALRISQPLPSTRLSISRT